MPPNAALSNGRRLAASGALVATAAGLATIAVLDYQWVRWSLLASAGAVAVAGIGLARTSMTAQLLSRATAWVVFAPTVLVILASTLVGHSPELTVAALALGSGGSLLLARPMLHTPSARADFAPSRYRSWLLAGATASAATGLVAGAVGLEALAAAWHTSWHTLGVAGAFGALGVALLGAAVGVVRMRAWGILLGALTSIVTLTTAAFMHDAAGLALSFAAFPGLMLLLPVLVASRERARDAAPPARIAESLDAVTEPTAPARIRVAPAPALAEEPDDFAPASAPPARARSL